MYNDNDGVILTSTLWDQSETIYINISGTQTALTGYTYNDYCPFVSPYSTIRSVTGCSNTADSQILYYYMEKGYTFDFHVTSSDYFEWKYDENEYYMSENPTLGQATISQINNDLSGDPSTKLRDGNFIAALNFYCGLKNNSAYGSSTSTSWWPSSYHDGTNAEVYKSVGFDSYFFIASAAYNSTSRKFFTSGSRGYELTDVGFSVLRENLDYGEIIRVGIPNHAIYMDGYRYNAQIDQYEYHLNYGWGVSSDSTRWYTVSQLRDLSLTYVTIDLSPDVAVMVTNSSGQYYGGSFLRGVERINHIQNRKSTTFSFADHIAGETITISSTVQFTSQVDLKFQNFCVNYISTASTGIVSSYAMDFELTGGSIAVNCDTGYSITGIEASALDIHLDNSWLYAGRTTSELTAAANVISGGQPYDITDFSSGFLASAVGTVYKGGSGADNLVLSNYSSVFGNMDFGSGTNTVTINNGSFLYGALRGSDNSLTLTMVIDDAVNFQAMVIADNAASENALMAITGGTIYVKHETDACGDYILVDGYSSAMMEDLQVQISVGNTTFSLEIANANVGNVYYTDTANYELLVDSDDLILSISDRTSTPMAAPSASADITHITNQNVTVTAQFSTDSVIREFSYDRINWFNYTGGIVFENNGTVYFRGRNAAQNYSTITSYTVNNIDKIAPSLNLAADITAPTNGTVTITATASDGTVEYYNGKSWVAGREYTVSANGTYLFRVTDAAGNVTEKSINISNINAVVPTLTITANITAPTNGDVTLTATASDGTVEYYDGESWVAGTEYTVSANGIYMFRVTDASGNVTSKSIEVTNIDKSAPTLEIMGCPTAWTNQDVVLTAAVSDGTVEFYNGHEWIVGNSLTVTANGTYTFRVTDLAGNVTTKSVTVDKIDKIAPAKPVVNAVNSNNSVLVTAGFSEDSVVKEYSWDGTTWQNYTSAVLMTANGVIYFRGQDAAGNYSDITSYEFTGIPENVKLYSSGQLISAGKVLNNIAVNSGGVMHVSSGGEVNSTTVASGGRLYLSCGGVINSTTVNSGGVMYVSRGGTNNITPGGVVNRTTVNSGAQIYLFGGTANDTLVNSRGRMYLSSGGTANNTILQSGGWFYVTHGGVASNTAVQLSCSMIVVQNGKTTSTTVRSSGAMLLVSHGGSGMATTVESGGRVVVVADGVLTDTTVNSGGLLYLSSGSVHRGRLQIESGDIVSAYAGSIIDFSLAGSPAKEEYLINDVSLIKGAPIYTITVSPNQASGTYKLARGAENFAGTISIGSDAADYGSITVNGEDLVYNDVTYSLKQSDGNLTLTVHNSNYIAPTLIGNANGTAWKNISGNKFVVEYSKDNYTNILQIGTADNAVDTFGMPAGSYQWRVKSEFGEVVNGDDIVSDHTATPQNFVSDADGNMDLFFANANGTWEADFAAEHHGILNGWGGTKEQVSLAGKNKMADVFSGSRDANILVLTDDSNGDALFVDDIYTALPGTVAEQQERIAQIDEIRAGAGDDIIDMTSQQFAYVGDGVKIYGGLGNDTIWANNGNNTLFGDAGNDRLVGGSGNDVLIGGAGNDSMHGGGGEDIFCFGGDWGHDTIEQLAAGTVTLWFETGSQANWDAENLTYTDGTNSVTVIGVSSVNLQFGDTANAVDGAFADAASEKIFEDKNNGMIA